MSKALVVFSGGQDSTTCLGMARAAGFDCYAIAFDYGQRHKIELEQATRIAKLMNVPLKIVDVREFGKLVAPATALVGDGDVSGESSLNANLPASFVPNRNAVFLTIAHGYAQMIGAEVLYTGVCQTDYSGYPDCRERFIERLENALNVGYESNIRFITPLMHMTKAETFKLAEEAGVLDIVINESHTCYEGKRYDYEFDENNNLVKEYHIHDWGHGCGECPACKLRAKGWEGYQAMRHIAESGGE